jgi:hypothetical protein
VPERRSIRKKALYMCVCFMYTYANISARSFPIPSPVGNEEIIYFPDLTPVTMHTDPPNTLSSRPKASVQHVEGTVEQLKSCSSCHWHPCATSGYIP